jgi:hypothetical protein
MLLSAANLQTVNQRKSLVHGESVKPLDLMDEPPEKKFGCRSTGGIPLKKTQHDFPHRILIQTQQVSQTFLPETMNFIEE